MRHSGRCHAKGWGGIIGDEGGMVVLWDDLEAKVVAARMVRSGRN